MMKYLAPLGVFVSFMGLALVVYLLFPALGDAGTQLAADVPEASGVIWGWDWITGAVRLIVTLLIFGFGLFAVGKTFLWANKD